jgi:hypothetical protein
MIQQSAERSVACNGREDELLVGGGREFCCTDLFIEFDPPGTLHVWNHELIALAALENNLKLAQEFDFASMSAAMSMPGVQNPSIPLL